jgi:hypothetical protein
MFVQDDVHAAQSIRRDANQAQHKTIFIVGMRGCAVVFICSSAARKSIRLSSCSASSISLIKQLRQRIAGVTAVSSSDTSSAALNVSRQVF